MTTTLDLGSLTADPKEIVQDLKRDLQDDWYPDSLGYEDLLEPEIASEALRANLNAGLYAPESRTEFNIPKKGFVLRYSLETNIWDRAYYHALVRYIAPYYDLLLPNQVLSHGLATNGDRAGRYFFLHPVEQWRLFEGYVAQEAQTKPVVLVTDIQNYYDNIDIKLLVSSLLSRLSELTASGPEKNRIRSAIGELERCLREWCYRPTHGLPQNRDASSFLANFFLLTIDREMLGKGYAYYRYLDDIRIATTNQYEARAALQHLIVSLRTLKLNVNAMKTRILLPSDKEYDEQVLASNSELVEIDNMWKSRSVSVIRRSFRPLQTLADKLIRERRTQDRAFRFCIKRFEKLALCPEIEAPASFFEPIVSVAIRELDNQPYSTDQLVRLLKAAPTTAANMDLAANFLLDRAKAIYEWQNFLLWQLLVYKRHGTDELLSEARIRVGRSTLDADRAGAILYLGALGTGSDRSNLATGFNSCTHTLLQRNAIIAVHELEYSAGIERHVKPYVLPSLKGTYKRIKEKFTGCYHRPLPKVHYLHIFDEVSAYD